MWEQLSLLNESFDTRAEFLLDNFFRELESSQSFSSRETYFFLPSFISFNICERMLTVSLSDSFYYLIDNFVDQVLRCLSARINLGVKFSNCPRNIFYYKSSDFYTLNKVSTCEG